MKRRDFTREFEQAGCVLHRHGSRHDVYRNQTNGKKAPAPRHCEIGDSLCRLIRQQLGIDAPAGEDAGSDEYRIRHGDGEHHGADGEFANGPPQAADERRFPDGNAGAVAAFFPGFAEVGAGERADRAA